MKSWLIKGIFVSVTLVSSDARTADRWKLDCAGTIGLSETSIQMSGSDLGVESALSINGVAVPNLLDFCRFEYRAFRCPHRSRFTDYEVSLRYPINVAPIVVVLRNTKTGSEFFEIKHCKQTG